MLNKAFVLEWKGWRQFARDFFVIQVGFMIFGLSINVMVNANLGTSPWVALEKGLTNYLPITLGQAIILVAAIIILLDVVLRQPLGWGTVANMACIGLWVDWLKPWVPVVPRQLWFQLPYLLGAVTLMGLATAIYVGVQAGAGPRDSLMLAIARLGRVSVQRARLVLEILVVTTAWLLGGPVGLGTVLFALAIGPAVQLAFGWLKVRPAGHADAGPAAVEEA